MRKEGVGVAARCAAALVCAVVLSSAIPAAAQSPSLLGLSRVLKAGETVYVTKGSEPVKGKFIEVSEVSLALSVNGRRQDFDLAAVTRVERERAATKKGALTGLLVGAVAFGIVAANANERCAGAGCNYGPGMSAGSTSGLLLGFGAGAGAGAGAAIGAAIKHRETVFQRR